MISVIMSTYHEPLEYVEKSVDSILCQTYGDFEFIISVDDPENRKLIDFLKNKADGDSRIKIIVNEKNIGLPKTLNNAIAVAKGDYIARMDADDISLPDRFECQLKLIEEKNLDLVGCNIIDIDGKDNVLNPKGTDFPTTDRAIKEFIRNDSAVPHPSWFGRKEIFEENKYNDYKACQDYDLLTRIAMKGYKLGNVKEPKLKYRISEKSISSEKKIYQKTVACFVRENYRNKKIKDLKDFKVFVRADEGKRKVNELINYYRMSAKLKKYRKESKLKFFRAGVRTFFVSPEGRRVIGRIIIEKLIRLRYGE